MVRVWRALRDVPADLGRAVVTIGNFDGVHRGHRHVLARAREVAGELGGLPVVAVTFDPHPFAVLRPEHAPNLLTTIEHRAELLAEAGVDDVLVVAFSREVAGWSPQEFVDRILVGALQARAVVVGANFRFGHKASGDVTTLHALGAERDFTAVGVELDGTPEAPGGWSSTHVRTCLAAGDIDGAAEALGRPFAVRGLVVEGDHRGRELGYPTANVPTEGMAAPADGVYAGWLGRPDRPDSTPLPAAVSVGTNPTFDGTQRRVESYVLDRDDLELYDVEVEVSFVRRLRGQVRFDSVDELLVQMADDVARTRLALAAAAP